MENNLRQAYEDRGKEYYRRYYSQLEGATIVKFLGMEDEGALDEFPAFLVRYKDGDEEKIQVSQDPEGNGGGFLFLPFEPDMDEYDRQHKLNSYAEVKSG